MDVNTLDRGAGTNTVTYSRAPRPVANLATATASGPSTDILISIENLDGSNSADSLTEATRETTSSED